MKLRVPVLAVLALLLSACSTATTDGTDSVADESPPEVVGTRSNPYAFGRIARIGDWEVRLLDINKDAADTVVGTMNEEPAEGRTFVVWAVEATYTGNESARAWIDLSWLFVGSAGNSFNWYDDVCYTPDDLFDTREVFSGGSVTGNVCVTADAAQVDGGTIVVQELDNSRTFFSVP